MLAWTPYLMAASDIEKANLFNTFFYSVFTQSSFNLPPLGSLPIPPSTICDITISESDVYDALTSLNPTKAMGIDGTKELCFSIVSTHLPSICFKPNTALFAQGVKVTSDHTYLQVRK